MRALVQKRKKAEELRRGGFSYNDIVKELGLAKSTLSNWLKDFPLTEEEKRYLKNCRDANISRGKIKAAAALRRRRLQREELVFEEAKQEFLKNVNNPFFQLGIALYWAEGSKRSGEFAFTNSDPEMFSFMADWIANFIESDRRRWRVRLYSHKLYAHEGCEEFWSQIIGVPTEKFYRTIYKPSGLLVKKRPNYKGCLRINAAGRKGLLKAIFWQKLLLEHYKDRGYSFVTNAPVAQRIER